LGQRVFPVAAALIVLSLVGFVLALVFQWPSDFVLGEKADSKVTLADFVPGTVTSIPAVPFAVLVVATLLVRSRRWWGTVANAVLTLLGGVFIVGGLGEITSESADVPKAVLVVAGSLYVLPGAVLVVTGVLDLVARWRSRTRSTK
jgi:hypothetical protein